jgi:hypothetical protein
MTSHRWGIPGMMPTYAGTAYIIARDGRIAALYHFLDKLDSHPARR